MVLGKQKIIDQANIPKAINCKRVPNYFYLMRKDVYCATGTLVQKHTSMEGC